jgi:hypothetical protein
VTVPTKSGTLFAGADDEGGASRAMWHSGDEWDAFGFSESETIGWKHVGFDAFEAALAHGDGFIPVSAAHSQRMLHKVAAAWRDAGLDSLEGLRWHQAGFRGPSDALRWRANDRDVASAMAARDGYLKEA